MQKEQMLRQLTFKESVTDLQTHDVKTHIQSKVL